MSNSSLSLIVEVKARHEEARTSSPSSWPTPMVALPAFSAGAHIDVQVPSKGQDTIIRQYSLCNHPEERDRYLIGVLRIQPRAVAPSPCTTRSVWAT